MRRGFPAELVAERVGISRASLWAVEKGSSSVAMGIYVAVLNALSLEYDSDWIKKIPTLFLIRIYSFLEDGNMLLQKKIFLVFLQIPALTAGVEF